MVKVPSNQGALFDLGLSIKISDWEPDQWNPEQAGGPANHQCVGFIHVSRMAAEADGTEKRTSGCDWGRHRTKCDRRLVAVRYSLALQDCCESRLGGCTFYAAMAIVRLDISLKWTDSIKVNRTHHKGNQKISEGSTNQNSAIPYKLNGDSFSQLSSHYAFMWGNRCCCCLRIRVTGLIIHISTNKSIINWLKLYSLFGNQNFCCSKSHRLWWSAFLWLPKS